LLPEGDTPVIGRSVISETVSAMISRMSDSTSFSARQRGRGGRPSKGPRATMTVRCPEPLAAAIETARAGSGLTTNDFVVGGHPGRRGRGRQRGGAGVRRPGAAVGGKQLLRAGRGDGGAAQAPDRGLRRAAGRAGGACRRHRRLGSALAARSCARCPGTLAAGASRFPALLVWVPMPSCQLRGVLRGERQAVLPGVPGRGEQARGRGLRESAAAIRLG